MKKPQDQNILKFPSGADINSLDAPENRPPEEATPEWKREISKRVQEHRKMKEMKEGLERLKMMDGTSPPVSEAEKGALDERFPPRPPSGDNLGLQQAALAERFPIRKPPGRSAPPPEENPPVLTPDEVLLEDETEEKDEVIDPGPTTDRLREQLLEAHQRMFGEVSDHLPSTEPPLDRPLVESPEAAPFDMVALSKNPDPSPIPATLASEDPFEQELTPEEYALPLEDILNRRRQKKAAQPKAVPRVDRTILLSRFLSGLVDSLILALFTGLLAGIIVMLTGADPFANRLVVLLPFFFVFFQFVYGYYFLTTSGQTIGMVLVGLQLQQGGRSRMSPAAASVRTAVYLMAVGFGCLGLLWGLFHKEARCWQDLLSDSYITRTS